MKGSGRRWEVDLKNRWDVGLEVNFEIHWEVEDSPHKHMGGWSPKQVGDRTFRTPPHTTQYKQLTSSSIREQLLSSMTSHK